MASDDHLQKKGAAMGFDLHAHTEVLVRLDKEVVWEHNGALSLQRMPELLAYLGFPYDQGDRQGLPEAAFPLRGLPEAPSVLTQLYWNKDEEDAGELVSWLDSRQIAKVYKWHSHTQERLGYDKEGGPSVFSQWGGRDAFFGEGLQVFGEERPRLFKDAARHGLPLSEQNWRDEIEAARTKAPTKLAALFEEFGEYEEFLEFYPEQVLDVRLIYWFT